MSVFVSFDYDNDRYYKFLIEAWHSNPPFGFTFQDGTSGEINSANVGRVKPAVMTKIQAATHTLVIVGQHANTPHRHRALIDHRNWINFDIAQSEAAYNRIVAVKIDRSYESPDELIGTNATWAMAFTEEAIMGALSQA